MHNTSTTAFSSLYARQAIFEEMLELHKLGVCGTEVPQWRPWAEPRQEVWGLRPPEAETHCNLL